MNPLVLWNWFIDWVLPFAVVFGTIVLVHELGHFLVARRAGVKVHEFAIGFGRAFVQWKRGETRYSIRIFPLGGFVKLAGMDPAVEREEEIAPDDERSFQRKPLWQRMAIIAAGPAANFLLAFLLLVVFYAAITVPFAVADVLPGSPAERAGILPGDRIVAVERQRVTNLAELSGALQQYPDQVVTVTVEREGARLDLPVRTTRDPATGRILIGVTVMGGGTAGKERLPLGESIARAARDTVEWTVSLVRWLAGVVTGRTPAEQVRDSVTGPIGIVVGLGESARSGIGYLLLFAAVLNVNLALVNLLPIPVLDGGWLLFLLIEAVRGRPLSPEHQGMAQFVGMTLLLALMAFVFYLDLTRLFG